MRIALSGPFRVAAVLVSCGLVAAACVNPLDGDEATPVTIGSEALDQSGSSGGSTEGAGGSGSDAAGGDVPVIEASFEDGDCPFEDVGDYEPRCGVVTVPMAWDADGGGTVDLAVAVFASTADSPASDPIIYLEGGPGSHALDTIEFVTEDFLDPLLGRGDVVFFDQRGAGHSTPRLECTEVTAVARQQEDVAELDRDVALAEFHQALAECRGRLLDDGIELTAYNSINNAHDVEAIRVALGYERWNLFGISYGTKLGLEVMRRHPEGVRAVVLDSVYPPQVDSVLENPNSFLASYQRVVAACNDDSACAADGDLAERVRAVIARFQADPVRVDIVDWISGDEDRVFVDGDVIANVITGALYSPSQFTDLPELIADLEQGSTDALSEFLSQDRTGERFFTAGMFYAIACQEEISFADPDEVAAAIPDDPFGLTDEFDLASNVGNLAFATCEAFENGQAPAISDTAVSSDLPTLVMAGAFDPVTPVSWAERAAETLPNSWLVVGPSASHGVSSDQCGISMVLAFLDRPEVEPDAGCLSEEELTFVGPPTDPLILDDVVFDIGESGFEVVTVQPQEWSVGSLDGDQYRRASFLDPAELYQLAGDEGLGLGLGEFIADSHRVELGPPQPFTGSIGSIEVGETTRSWDRRTGRTDSAAVEWFETDVDGFEVYVILVAPIDELEVLVSEVLVPALETIEVTRSL